jgi:hypothetical protein
MEVAPHGLAEPDREPDDRQPPAARRVTVAAVPYSNTPVVLTLHWHGFVELKLADVTDAT